VKRRVAARFVMRRSDAVVALSEVEAAFQRRAYALRGARHVVVPNGIPAGPFDGTSAPRAAARPWRLLYVGQLIREKGVDELVRAVALLPPDATLDLVYHVDTVRAELEAEARSHRVLERVRFVGGLSGAALAERYLLAHVLVLPSQAESLPSVITEAMLAGTPVVAPAIGGIPEQVGRWGVLVERATSERLACAIREVLDRYDEWDAARETLRADARRRFDPEEMVVRHERLYGELVAARGGPRRRTLRNEAAGMPISWALPWITKR
jgi:glycosyltransferase involved in cell wall biosynthesis